jgi:hypothetical protein
MKLKELEDLLTDMKPRTKVYNMVKREMIKRGRWKNKPRGKPYTAREEG